MLRGPLRAYQTRRSSVARWRYSRKVSNSRGEARHGPIIVPRALPESHQHGILRARVDWVGAKSMNRREKVRSPSSRKSHVRAFTSAPILRRAALRLCSCTPIQLELVIRRCRQSATMRAAPPAAHRSASQRRAKHAECGGPNAMAATPAASVQRRAGSSACTARGRDRLGNYASIAHSPPLDQRRRQGRSTVMKSRRRGREECEPSRSIWSASARP